MDLILNFINIVELKKICQQLAGSPRKILQVGLVYTRYSRRCRLALSFLSSYLRHEHTSEPIAQ